MIGFGAPNRQGTEKAHGAPLGADEVAKTRAALDWPHQPFAIPDVVMAQWREIGARGQTARRNWIERTGRLNAEPRSPFHDALNRESALRIRGRRWISFAIRFGSRTAEHCHPAGVATGDRGDRGSLAEFARRLGRPDPLQPHPRQDAAAGAATIASQGSYIHYGVREHAMAAAMNGIALHGGFIPYGGTFLTFADYSRPAIRLAALMGIRVIHVMTHDSIGLGEDGPTHQPVEHLASLRAIPNLLVFRPGDAVETAEAWDCALQAAASPSVLCLSRQALPSFRDATADANRVARGAYVRGRTARAAAT